MKLNKINPFPHLKDDEMPIGAWVSPPVGNYNNLYNKNFITNESYQDIAYSGINTIYALYENCTDYLDDVLNALDYAEMNNIGYLVRDSRVSNAKTKEELEKALMTYKDKKAFSGVLVEDEPGLEDVDRLVELKKNFQALLPDKAFYLNFLPIYAEDYQFIYGVSGKTEPIYETSYDKYYDSFITKTAPNFFSIDYYPFTGDFPHINKDYFKQISIIRKKAIKAGIPYWVFIQCCSFNKNVRIPDKEEITWQVATSLAYGVKGIQYFTYFIPIDTENEYFQGSLINKDGSKTPIYHIVREINQHIACVSERLMNSMHLGIMVIGNSPAPIPEYDLLSSIDKVIDITGKAVLVGCFDYQGHLILYIVNNAIVDEEEIQSTKITFDQVYDLEIIQQSSVVNKVSDQLEVTISLGEGVLIQLK